jgi:hypothetical protein
MKQHPHRHPTRRNAGASALALIIAVAQGCTTQADLAPDAIDSSPEVSAASSEASSAVLPPPADVPPEFQYVWIGDNRSVPALSADERLSSIFMFGAPPDASQPDPARLSFFEQLPSRVTELSAERMTVVITDDGADCRAGDRGTYRWSLSAAGDELRLELVDDACATRAAALPGTWTRSDCPLFPEDFCLGDLEPGTHRSSFFDPFAPLDAWEYRRGVLTYTVPDGWANTGDYPEVYVLAPDSAEPNTGIYMSSDIFVVSDAGPCAPRPSTTVARTPSDMAAWIVSRPGIVATEPLQVTIGGLTGLVLDLVPDADATSPCFGDGDPYLPLFTDSGAGSGLVWGLAIDDGMRVYLLEIGDARTIAVLIQGDAGGAYESLLAAAVPIVESFQFSPPD